MDSLVKNLAFDLCPDTLERISEMNIINGNHLRMISDAFPDSTATDHDNILSLCKEYLLAVIRASHDYEIYKSIEDGDLNTLNRLLSLRAVK